MERKILIAGNDPGVLAALQRALADEGWEVELGLGTGKAPHRLIAGEPDLVLLAAELTADEEWGFVRDLREISGVPLIIIGGGHDVERRVRSLRLGADDYVSRPLRLDELKARIQAILRRRSTYSPPNCAGGANTRAT